MRESEIAAKTGFAPIKWRIVMSWQTKKNARLFIPWNSRFVSFFLFLQIDLLTTYNLK